MQIAFLLYDGFTALDATGPYDVLRKLPDCEPGFVAERAGAVRDESGTLALVADPPLAEVGLPGVGARPVADRVTAQAIQLAIECDPKPPFDAGLPAKAPAEVVETVSRAFGEQANACKPRPVSRQLG